MRRKWLVPLLLLALLTLCFLWGVTGYPHPAQLPSGGSLEAPSAAHWLGTDNLGVDIYAQISAGFFRSLGIGLAAAAFTFAVGGGLGILAGFVGGWADALISFLIQVLLAIPQLPVMIVIGAFLGQSTWNLVWIIAAFSWAPVARQMRAKTISIRRRDYVQMARLYGGGTSSAPTSAMSCGLCSPSMPWRWWDGPFSRSPPWPFWACPTRWPAPGV